MTIACGDSHSTTHGAIGALAPGIGTSDVEQILATQCLVLRRPKTLNVHFRGELPRGTYAKDVALAFIGRYKTDFATGFAFEFSGETVSGFSMESRMTFVQHGSGSGRSLCPDWCRQHGDRLSRRTPVRPLGVYYRENARGAPIWKRALQTRRCFGLIGGC